MELTIERKLELLSIELDYLLSELEEINKGLDALERKNNELAKPYEE